MSSLDVQATGSRWAFARRGAVLAAVVSAAAGAFAYGLRSAAQTPAAGTAAFEIRLHRRASVGMRGRVTSEGEKHQTMRVMAGGQVQRNTQEDARVHFRAVERVLAVAPNGKSSRVEFTVERLESDDARGVHALVPAGTVLTLVRAPHDTDAQVTVGGRPVEPPVRAAMEVVESLGLRGPTDDDIFGTAQRQPVGASWSLHAGVAQQDLAAAAGIAAVMSGQARLNARTAYQQVDCLEVSAVMNGTMTAMPDLPPGSVIRTGTMRASHHGMFPLAANMQSLSSTTEISMEVVVDLPPDPAGVRSQLQLSMHGGTTKTYAPL